MKEDSIKNLQEIEQALAAAEDKLKLVQGCDMPSGDDDDDEDDQQSQQIWGAIQNLAYAISSIKSSLGYMQDTASWQNKRVNDHMNNGHLPEIKSQEQMKRAIAALGLQDEYSVQPKYVFASEKGGKVKTITASYVKDVKK